MIDVELLKKHLNIEYLEEGDKEYINSILEAAQSRIEQEINQPLETFETDGKLSPTLVQAILLLAGTLYANREAVAYANVQPVPYTLSYLIQPFKKYV